MAKKTKPKAPAVNPTTGEEQAHQEEVPGEMRLTMWSSLQTGFGGERD